MIEVSRPRLDYLLQCERDMQALQVKIDEERQSKQEILDWAKGIRRQNTSLISKQKKISKEEAKRNKFLVNKRLGRIGED